MKTLCVLSFETAAGNKYIYDGNTATVLPVDDVLMDCIMAFGEKDCDSVRHELYERYGDSRKVNTAIAFVEDFIKNKGAFYRDGQYEQKERKWLHDFDGHSVQSALELAGFMEQIVINVTEDCNLRCRYCFLSETYENTRNRTGDTMNEAVAFQALDFFFLKMKKIAEYNPGKMCAVTFYGGEPLLNFSLIQKCIDYTKKNCPVSFIFNLTTNGILLKGEIADYLVENQVFISVSLDGTKENHDRTRVCPDASGSYEIVYNNIKEFQQRYPEYIRINILCVFDYGTDLRRNEEYFRKEKLPRIGFINQVLPDHTDYYKQFTGEEEEAFRNAYIQMLNQFFNNKRQGRQPFGYADMMFETSLALVLCRGRAEDKRLPILPFTNTCMPGTKISVRTDGTFDMCEKIDYHFPIGDVYQGFDYEGIAEVIKSYNQAVTGACHTCPISKVCTVCFARCTEKDTFCQIDCRTQIDIFLFQLTLVYSLYEENPDVFNYFENKVEWTFQL